MKSVPWKSKRVEDLEVSDFSIHDDDPVPFTFIGERFVYKNKAVIKGEEAIAEAFAQYKERSRNLSPFDAIAPPYHHICGCPLPSLTPTTGLPIADCCLKGFTMPSGEYKLVKDLQESDFSMYDDHPSPYSFKCERFFYKNKAMIKREESIAEYKEYCRNLSPDDDPIAPPPNSGLCGCTVPITITAYLRPRLIQLCKLALDKYNADNQGANFVFVDLVKSTSTRYGNMYFITFQARGATIETFQAKVWASLFPADLEPMVKSCSMKPA